MENRGSAAERVRRNVTALRKQHGWTLATLAEHAAAQGWPGVTVNTLSKVERGARTVSVPELEALAAAFGLWGPEQLLEADARGSARTLTEGAEVIQANRDAFERLFAAYREIREATGWSETDLNGVIHLSHGDVDTMPGFELKWNQALMKRVLEKAKKEHPGKTLAEIIGVEVDE